MNPTTSIRTEQLCSSCGAAVKVNRYGCFGLHFATEPSGQHELCPTSGRLAEEVGGRHE
jgi:hypothetical protein